MTSLYSSSLLQIFAIVLFSWVLIGIAGKDIFNNLLTQMSEAFENRFSEFSETLIIFAGRILQYFDATDIEIAQRINANWDEVASEVNANNIEQNDKPILASRIKIEKMTGTILWVSSFIALFYANYLLIMENLSMISPQDVTSPNVSMPYKLAIIVWGLTISNGLYVLDILGVSNYTNIASLSRGNERTREIRKTVLRVISFSLILTIILFIFISVGDIYVASIAFSLIVVPIMLTTSISLGSMSGILLILAFLLSFFGSISASALRYILIFSIGIIRAYINILWILFDNTIGIPLRVFRNK